ncbi:family 1 glycosylhydrolase [Albibacterium bauzanense]|uniref:Glycosyl hydrolase family 1 n=1 Tax=Albibacterium bauzanense TaxID=653929 RepID=A0A4R1M6D1_9SPHI|nr:family 1 glycosylhydrolase [Albibacterium bauzanense]TCK85303.1 glycosyl hydrolase family 1 [Albibacterium bauzanense]
MSYKESPFQSFWMGGFECSDKINCFGDRVDLLKETDHINQLKSDYEMLLQMNIDTVREGIRWSVVETKPFHYDFDTVKFMMDTGDQLGIQQVWDLCHFGYPDDLSPLHPQFTQRFVGLCTAFANFFIENYGKKELIITPINEVSFISWLGGEAAGTVPFCTAEGWNVKYKLMHAYIEGVKCLKKINPNFKILSTEPLVSIIPNLDSTEEQIKLAQAAHENQFQVLDMLTGKICPELGGTPECVDIIGLNFYYNNQWVHNSIEGIFLPWANEHSDPRWRPLHSLIEEVYQRYHFPIILAETSHSGEHRPNWIHFISDECNIVLSKGIPFWGICIYPIIDRPDWDHLDKWHHSGVWDHISENGIRRQLNEEYANKIIDCQLISSNYISKTRL